MKTLVFTSILIARSCLAQAASGPLVLHVAPNGDDTWTGAAAASTGGSDGPLATIMGARDRVRSVRSSGGGGAGVTVLIHQGTYRLSGPLEFGPVDGGEDNDPVVYRGAPGEERPIISGGRPIDGWSRDGAAWTATLPEDFSGPQDRPSFGGLWMDDQRRPRARTPNEGFLYIADALPEAKQSFRFFERDLSPDWVFDPESGAGAVVSVYHIWEVSLHHLQSVRASTRSATMTAPLEKEWATFQPSQRYRVENIREALDAPGEWFLDVKTRGLTYLPLGGEASPEGRAVAPILQTLVRISGSAERPVTNLAFEGLAFEHSDWQVPPEGVNDGIAAYTLPAAIETRWARNVRFVGCRFAHLGGYAVHLADGSAGCLLRQCEMTDLGGGGIKIGQPDARVETVDQATCQNTLDNCFIHDAGVIRPSADGVWIGRSSGNTISHNEICDLAGPGISVGWYWGYGTTRTSGNTITANNVHHIGGGVLSDMGAIYLCGEQPNTEVSYNFVHDVDALEKAYGLYADAGCSFVNFHHNIIANTIAGAVMAHYGHDLSFRNNIFAFSHADQFNYPGEPERPSEIEITGNVFLYNNGQLLGPDWGAWHTNPLNKHQIDGNLYFDASGREPRFGPLPFSTWQGIGKDQRGTVADPMFVNPQALDFRIRPGSPLVELHFEPIDQTKIGLYGDADWVALPSKFTHDAFPLPSPDIAGISDGFETTRVGMRASDATTNGESPTDDVSIRVTDRQAAQGRHALEFRMAGRWRNPARSLVSYRPYLPVGPISAGFSVLLSPDRHGGRAPILSFDLSDSVLGPQPDKGPQIRVSADAWLEAAGARLVRLTPGRWARITVSATTGQTSAVIYSIAVTTAGLPSRAWQVRASGLAGLECVQIASPPESGTSFWIDDVSIVPSGTR